MRDLLVVLLASLGSAWKQSKSEIRDEVRYDLRGRRVPLFPDCSKQIEACQATPLEVKADCEDPRYLCAPFDEELISLCRTVGGGRACDGKIWNRKFYDRVSHLVGFDGRLASPTERLLDFYSRKKNYEKVLRAVRDWYPPATYLGCVAFASTALRMIGIPIPLERTISRKNPSLSTAAFARHLQEELSWEKILEASHLRPGDLVFTENGTNGAPTHVFMFAGWIYKRARIVWAIDNHGFAHTRNLSKSPVLQFDRFQFALRARTGG